MSFIKAVNQKVASLAYQVKAKKFRQSEQWRDNPHKKHNAKTDWEELHQRLEKVCSEHGVPIENYNVDRDEYIQFKKQFEPSPLWLYAINCRDKKMMEHFIAYDLLSLDKGDRYLDIASENSPFPSMLRDRVGVEAYSLDLTYEAGVHGYQIGSSADEMPVEDNWVDKASLQCAFEHFQGNIDTQFVRELSKKLKPGGSCVILPLYMSEEFTNIYDPILYQDWNSADADKDATIVAEIGLGGHYERFYSPEYLNRVFIPDIGLKYTLYKINGKQDAVDKKDKMTRETVSRIRYALKIDKTL